MGQRAALRWLKKRLPVAVELKRQLIEPGHPELSLRRQCELIDHNRFAWYYQTTGESEYNLHLIRLIDEQYIETLFYGWPRMTAQLRHLMGAKHRLLGGHTCW